LYRFQVIASLSSKVVDSNPLTHPICIWSSSNCAWSFASEKYTVRGYRVALFVWSYV